MANTDNRLRNALSRDERRVVRWAIHAIYPDVSNSIEYPMLRWAMNLMLLSPNVPLWVRPLVESILKGERFHHVRDAVCSGLLDNQTRDTVAARYKRHPWPKLGIFPDEWRTGKPTDPEDIDGAQVENPLANHQRPSEQDQLFPNTSEL
jgi:hypothetical protein